MDVGVVFESSGYVLVDVCDARAAVVGGFEVLGVVGLEGMGMGAAHLLLLLFVVVHWKGFVGVGSERVREWLEISENVVELRWVVRMRVVERVVAVGRRMCVMMDEMLWCRCMVLPSAGYTMALSLCCQVWYLFHHASSYGLSSTKQQDSDTKRANSASTSLSSPYRVPCTLSLRWRRQGGGWMNNITPRLVIRRRTRLFLVFLPPNWFN